LVPENQEYYPEKVMADSSGVIYVLSFGFYQGAVCFEEAGRFLGFFGSNQVTVTNKLLSDRFWRLFLTKAQKDKMTRYVALISGLIDRRHPGEEKTGRQVTVSTDLIYDVLRKHEPDHILLQATWADAAAGLLDVVRLGAMLSRIKGRIMHKPLARISPLAVPVMLEIGKERVEGEAREDILREAAADLIRDAMGDGGL
jgi:hypothetical protein